jgi:hypothetical protein
MRPISPIRSVKEQRMTPRPVPRRLALAALLGGLCCLAVAHGRPAADDKTTRDDKRPTRAKFAWTCDEALKQLELYPRDAYLQYVAMQTARRENRTRAAGEQVERFVFADESPEDRRQRAANRRDSVDLFSIFTGALAVQESLQLDTMRGERRRPREPRLTEMIDVAKLSGPTIKSHPWKEMLGDKKPEIDPLAQYVPEDQYYVRFRSLSKMLELMDSGDLWAVHLGGQTSRDARTQLTGERLRGQLVIETNKVLRPLYDGVVEEVVITGSDLFFNEGTDVTLIFKAKQPDLLKARMDGFLAKAELRKDVKRSEGKMLGVDYVHLASPDRDVHVFSAYPAPDLHVRSNSKVGLRRFLEAFKGKTEDGKDVKRLADSLEFKYIRTLMPLGAKEEDGFVYLSDPFIRHLVGPALKLRERRRMIAYNHLRMIGHAALMFRTERGRAPKSLDELAETECLPGKFNQGDLVCPDGGKYSLAADGLSGVSSTHGHAHFLVPCCENPLTKVAGEEADEYKAFLDEYNSYWRTFFDPIAVRAQVTPKSYRLETIVLPLIDNSIYTGLAQALNGKPEPLDALPVPKRNIFSFAGRFNKEALLREYAQSTRQARDDLARELHLTPQEARDFDLVRFLDKGLGNQVGLHMYDSVPTFDLDYANMLGLMFGTFNGGNRNVRSEEVWVSFIIASLTAPVYIAIPVQDAKIVDDFLNNLDKVTARLARRQENFGFGIRLSQDFYTAKLADGSTMRCHAFQIGPVKWRVFWARIGGGLYIASKPFILDDLVAAEKERKEGKVPTDGGAPAHGMVKLRPANWNEVLPEYRLAWAENNRRACLNNLGPLTSVARAVLAEHTDARGEVDLKPEELAELVLARAAEVYAVRFYCPDGGKYVVDPKTGEVSSSLHGTVLAPRQGRAPAEGTPSAKAMGGLAGASASLTFLEDGLHAVLTIDRK